MELRLNNHSVCTAGSYRLDRREDACDGGKFSRGHIDTEYLLRWNEGGVVVEMKRGD